MQEQQQIQIRDQLCFCLNKRGHSGQFTILNRTQTQVLAYTSDVKDGDWVGVVTSLCLLCRLKLLQRNEVRR